MEVHVSGSEGLSDDHILQIRAGQVRRQSKLAVGLPFQFPLLPQSSAPLKVEVFQRVCSKGLTLSPDAEQYVVHVPALEEGGCESKLRLKVECGSDNKVEEFAPPGADAAAEPSSPGRRIEAAAEARAYLQAHDLTKYMQDMVASVLRERPDDPWRHMCAYASRDCDEPNASQQRLTSEVLLPKPPPGPPPADKARDAKARHFVPASTNERCQLGQTNDEKQAQDSLGEGLPRADINEHIPHEDRSNVAVIGSEEKPCTASASQVLLDTSGCTHPIPQVGATVGDPVASTFKPEPTSNEAALEEPLASETSAANKALTKNNVQLRDEHRR